MKRSTTLLLVSVIVFCTLVVAFGTSKESGEIADRPLQVGRFVLESGEYLAPSRVAERRLPGIFKIDTATGKVWKYTTNITNKKMIEKWVPIPE